MYDVVLLAACDAHSMPLHRHATFGRAQLGRAIECGQAFAKAQQDSGARFADVAVRQMSDDGEDVLNAVLVRASEAQ